MPSQLRPIYASKSETLADIREALACNPQDPLPEGVNWASAQPLLTDLRAQAATGRERTSTRTLSLKVCFIDEGGEGQGRMGELTLELVTRGSGALYPSARMAGVLTDAAWDSAWETALTHAQVCGFGIPAEADVRWTVHVLRSSENFDEHQLRALCPADSLTGRSAGVAFFLGLFALAQAEEVRGEWRARSIVESMVALATLPEAPGETLGTLGRQETKKLETLRALPAGTRIIVILPENSTEGLRGSEPLWVDTVAALATALRERTAGARAPDGQPSLRRVARYVGGAREVKELSQSLKKGGLHVVTGPGGVGKTARVVEAAEPLWHKGHFSGGRFWIDLYKRGEGQAPDLAAAKTVTVTCGETPEEKVDELRTQPLRLLAGKRALILLEGAETVSESDFDALLALFPGQTVVWMTRRDSDADALRAEIGNRHEVLPLGSEDALELLCDGSERQVEALTEQERPDWEAIASAAEYIPQFLVWAGIALHQEWWPELSSAAAASSGAIAASYLAEINRNPLDEIAHPDPSERQQKNAGRFLHRSLERIVPGNLKVASRRLFAALAAFDPQHGAPSSWWALAAGLDPARDRRLYAGSRRALIHLGLVEVRKNGTDHPVHALAGAAAQTLWRERPAEERRLVIEMLATAASEVFAAPSPDGWFRDQDWIDARTAEAGHFRYWVEELVTTSSPPVPQSLDLGALGTLEGRWLEFLQQDSQSFPLFDLNEAGWSALNSLYYEAAKDHPKVPDFQRNLSVSWRELGDVRAARQDWDGAEEAFQEAMKISSKLAIDHPKVPGFQQDLSLSWEKLGDVRKARQDWDGAEEAFLKFMKISSKLAIDHPKIPGFQQDLSISWGKLGDVRAARQNWDGAEEAFQEAMKISSKLAMDYPKVPDFQRNLSVSWGRLGDVRAARQNWDGAEEAFLAAMKISSKLAMDYPKVPDFQLNLSLSWEKLGDVRAARQD